MSKILVFLLLALGAEKAPMTQQNAEHGVCVYVDLKKNRVICEND